MMPNTESITGAIETWSSARVPDLARGLPEPEAVDELEVLRLEVGVGVNVTLGMSDEATAEMGPGD